MNFGILKRRPLVLSGMSAVVVCSTVAMAIVYAQPPGRGNRDDGDGGVESSLKKLMAYDANNDGKLTKDEITDSRLAPLLQRADADNDGVVTKEELKALLTKEAAASPRGERGGPGGPPDGGFGPPGGGPGGPGGPGGRGPGGRGGPGGGPGQVLPMFLQDELGLTEAQRRDIQDLQKEVDARLAKILTADQQKQLQDMRNRGPGRGGPGGPGGGPPGGGRGGDQNNGARRPQRPE